ncbi:MAG TPA: 50S ribosomal protein L2 [Candidatus Angelobacter sp.]|jgi:large subunit ribosomal protein L2|nr:50S ribosomal protein L2 [Candidatus Angelobacter sp.]
MSVKRLKPTTPSQRFKVLNSFKEITCCTPEKSLTKGIRKRGGRNNSGKMTIRNVGGGQKRKYRKIDYQRNKFGIPAKVKTIEYDPNRSSFISLLFYADGEKRYIITTEGIHIGQKVISGKEMAPNLGNALPLSQIPLGALISCIELNPGKGAVFARSAGSYAQLSSKEGKYATVKLPSGEIRRILASCLATLGSVSNSDHQLVRSGKAGRSRNLGRRPRVRGVAMNPVDHPMGGGEGKASGGHPRSRNGLYSKGLRTKSIRYQKYFIEQNKK